MYGIGQAPAWPTKLGLKGLPGTKTQADFLSLNYVRKKFYEFVTSHDEDSFGAVPTLIDDATPHGTPSSLEAWAW